MDTVSVEDLVVALEEAIQNATEEAIEEATEEAIMEEMALEEEA